MTDIGTSSDPSTGGGGLFTALNNMFDPKSAANANGYFSNPNFTAIMGMLQGLGAASGASRLPVTNGQVLAGLAGGALQGSAAGTQNQLQQQQVQDLQTRNALNKLSLAGYQRWSDILNGSGGSGSNGSSAPIPGSLAPRLAGGGGVTSTPDGRLVDSSTGQRVGPVNLTAGSSGATPGSVAPPTADDASGGGSAGVAPGTGTPSAAAGAMFRPAVLRPPMQGIQADPRPLFNTADVYRQYTIAAGNPGMAPIAAQLLGLLQKGVPEGGYLAQDGGIYARPNYDQFVRQKAAAEQMGKNLQTTDASGRIVNVPGAVSSNAEMAGGVAGAQSRAQLPQELQKIGAQGEQERQNIAARAAYEPQDYYIPGANGTLLKITGTRAMLPRLTGNNSPLAGVPEIPENLKGTYAADDKFFADTLLPGSEAAKNGQANVRTVLNGLEQMRQAALTRPGQFAASRIYAAKAMNDVIQSLGGDGFDQKELAGADAMEKASTRLAADMTRVLGSREAAQIFMKMQGANPNWALSTQSNHLVANLIYGSFQRAVDRYNAGLAAKRAGGLAQDGVNAWDQAHPESDYVDAAFRSAGMSRDWIGKPDPNAAAVAYLKGKPDADTIAQFNAKYGKDRAALYLGQQGASQ